MIVRGNPEFGVEIALMVPYAYWLHKHGQLDGVVTSKGMAPFYYFCDNVEESFQYRTIDNAAAGLNELPNNWIHGINSLEEPAVLDYTQWECPPYREYYGGDEYFGRAKPTIFVTNKWNLEHGEHPAGYFDLTCLSKMFSYLTDKGYNVVYKRASNREAEYTIDQNEANSLRSGLTDIVENVQGIGPMTDKQLTEYYRDVWLFEDLANPSNLPMNEVQLRIMANSVGYISVCGGNSIFSSLFGKKVITYVHKGKELRPNYFGPESYFRKLSGANVIPVLDVMGHLNTKTYGHPVNNTGTNDYTGLLDTIRREF